MRLKDKYSPDHPPDSSCLFLIHIFFQSRHVWKNMWNETKGFNFVKMAKWREKGELIQWGDIFSHEQNLQASFEFTVM